MICIFRAEKQAYYIKTYYTYLSIPVYLEVSLVEFVLKNTPNWRRIRNNKPLWWSKNIDKVWKRKKICWCNYRLSQNHSDLL